MGFACSKGKGVAVRSHADGAAATSALRWGIVEILQRSRAEKRCVPEKRASAMSHGTARPGRGHRAAVGRFGTSMYRFRRLPMGAKLSPFLFCWLSGELMRVCGSGAGVYVVSQQAGGTGSPSPDEGCVWVCAQERERNAVETPSQHAAWDGRTR